MDVPTIVVKWDPEKQLVGIGFNPDHFKTWDFVIACLEMAVKQAESNARLMQIQAIEQGARAHQEFEQVKGLLRGK